MCETGNHAVGHISGKTIRCADWDAAVTAFENVIDDFNVRGQREQIPHPGWCTKFKFCPDCGASLADLGLRDPDWKS